MKAQLRVPILGVLLLALGALNCGREVTGPGGGFSAGAVSLRPVFRDLRVSERMAPVDVTGLVDFVRVRVVLLRANGDTAVNRVVEFPADSQSIALTLPVVLSTNAGSDGETLNAVLRFVNTAGDTVFNGGPIQVQARAAGAPPVTPPEIPLTYTGPGATAASIVITPRTFTGESGAQITFSALVRDAQGATLAGTPVAFVSPDTALVQVGLQTGVATLRGLKGQATVYATTLTGQRDSALVTVVAPPSQLGYLTQPTAVSAGAVLPAVRVAVLDAARDTVRGFVGTMHVALSGGPTGTTLGGTTRVTVNGGIARFADLTVDRAGSGYRLVATLDSVSGVPAATSDTFSIAPGVPATITLLSGAGQTVPQGGVFPDSVVVRVTDRFGTPVPNAVVRFEVVLGEGTVSPPTVTTGTAGVAATQWTAGGPGPQRLGVSVDTLTPLTVDGIALASSGPPLLYVGTEVASLGVGRTTPITAYLSNPARATTTITLRSRTDTIAQWATATVTIPLNGTQTNASLTGRRLGSTWVVLESAVGTDSVLVTVDSTGMRFGPLPVEMMVTDTIRTAIVLDAPAPVGGLTVTVRSADSTRVRLAPGSGTGVLEQPVGDEFCYDCNALRAAGDEGQLLAPPSGTATLTVPAGQLSAQLIVLPVAPASDTTGAIALTASAPGVSAVTSGVFPIAATVTGDCFYCTIPVGHGDGMFLGTAATLRRPLSFAITTPDTAVVRLLASTVMMPAGQQYASPARLLVGRSAGTARVIVSAPGFAPDTTVVTVLPPAIQLASYTGALLRIGSQLDLRVSLGYTDSTSGGFYYGSPLADTVAVTMISSDTAVVLPDFTRRVLAAGESGARFPVTGRQAGTATLSVSAPGYGTSTFGVEVLGGGEEVFLTVPTTTGIGVVTPIEINLPPYGPSRLAATAFTITSSDTTVLRVLTPRVTLASGAAQVVGQVEGIAPGPVLLSVRRDTTLVATISTTVVAPRLVSTGVPARLESGESSEILLLTEADQVRSTSDLLLGVLRSTNPAVLEVTDSVLRFVPGEFGAVGVVRGVSAGTAALIASVPGYPSDTLATITVSAPRLVIPVSAGELTAGPGIEWRIPVERKSATLGSLPIAVSVTGSGGASVVSASDSIAAGTTVREVRVRGGSATGADTVRVTAAGLEPASYVLPAGRSWFTLAGETAVPVEVAFQVGGGLAMAPGFFDDSLTRRPVAATTLRYRLVSLDTGIVRVVEDTVEIAMGASFAARLATARGLRPGVARLTATRLGTTGPEVDTVTVEVTPSRLWHNVAGGELRLGMQQRTEDGELFVSREYRASEPTWVRLTSSAPSVVTVPDSVLIPEGEVGAPLVVSAQDTVGTALITAQALGHEGASFTVTVTRARLLVAAPGNLVTGTRLPHLILPAAGSLIQDYGPVLRKHTAPIPLRLVSDDTTVARWTSDTVTIPVGQVLAEALLVGQRAGTLRLSIEDRRTTFPQLTPIEGTMEVQPGLLQVTGGYLTYGGMPVVQAGVGLTSYPQNVEIETNGYREGLVVTFRSLTGRVGFTPDTLVLRDEYFGVATFRAEESIGVRGIVAGVDTVEIGAVGHRPDTVLVRIDQGYLETDGPVETTNLRVGDSTLVVLPLRSPSGDSAIVATAMALSVTASPTLVVSGAGVSAANGVRFSSLGVGSSHSCGIEVGTKRAFCWGANSFGQVGDSTAGVSKAIPTPVQSPLAFTAVAAGMTSSCGIAEGGAAHCWGSNLVGQLGTGSESTGSETAPVTVAGGLTFTQIAVGSDFACGLTSAGKARCWGSNTYGQLGTGDTLTRRAPAVVNDDLTFTQLTTGYASTCALTASGAAYCWGRNGSGLLAVGTTEDQLTPAPVVGGLSFTQISAGDFHTCAVAIGGAAYCWGSNSAGQLGVTGGTGFATTPQPVAGGLSFASISAGRQQSCGRTTGGAGYCWGINTYGQLGDGSTTLAITPVAVSGGLGFAALQTGSGFTCGIVVSTAYCWGSNFAGELGVGFDPATSALPLALGDPATVTLTLPAGATQARFWVRGTSVGPSKLTVTGALLQTFELQGAVRAP